MAANSSTPPLPVLATVWTAYTLTYRGFGHFLQIAGRWLLLLFVIVFAIEWLPGPLVQSEILQPILLWPSGFLRNLPFLFIGAVIAVPWHRYIILGESKPNPFTSIDQTRLTYFVVAAAISFASSILLMPLEWLENVMQGGSVGATLTRLLMTFVAAVFVGALTWRASIFLPGLALREHVDFGTVWLRTKGNTLRILLGGVLSMLPFVIAMMLVFAVFYFVSFSYIEGAIINNRIGLSLMSATIEVSFLLIGLSGLTFLTVAYHYFFPEGSTGVEAA